MSALALVCGVSVACSSNTSANVNTNSANTNISQESLEYLASIKGTNQKLVVDTVSIKKSERIKNILDKIDVLKTNKLELESIFGKTFRNKKEIRQAMRELIAKGVKDVYITLGYDGILAMNAKKSLKLPLPIVKHVEDITGASDIFTAALVYCAKNDLPLTKTAKVAQAASVLKMEQTGTIPEEFSFDLLNEKVKELYNQAIFNGEDDEEL